MFKPESIPESGALARCIAKMAQHYHAPVGTWKLTLQFEEGKFSYLLAGRDSGGDTFEEVGATPEQVMQRVNQTLAGRYAGKMSTQSTPASASGEIVQGSRTKEQLQEIIRLLNHPLIERQEKTNTLLRIQKYSEAEAAARIATLRDKIEARENPAPELPNKHLQGIADFIRYHG